MSRRLRSANVLLEKINDIDAECSEDDQEILDMEIDNTENYDPLETDSNTDENEENISNNINKYHTVLEQCKKPQGSKTYFLALAQDLQNRWIQYLDC
ncbi:hypothetical protein M0802_012474 [Mischocyttarus mexicanus]|nr:hypothetical protein M0802_012474 [Mischocyttarus mexicanus]